MRHVEFDRDPPATLTTMVMAFGGWIDAGRAATGALRHLVSDLPAARVARLDPEDFFVFTQERPEVRLRPDETRDLRWPASEVFAWQPGGERDGLLLFCGPEPHLRWQTYTKAFLDVAERCGVKRIVSLGTLLAGAPHTRPVPVTARCTDPIWRARLEAWGIYRPPTYEGPTGISTVVLDAAERRGMAQDRKSTRLNSSHLGISYAVFCLKKKTKTLNRHLNFECVLSEITDNTRQVV